MRIPTVVRNCYAAWTLRRRLRIAYFLAIRILEHIVNTFKSPTPADHLSGPFRLAHLLAVLRRFGHDRPMSRIPARPHPRREPAAPRLPLGEPPLRPSFRRE